MNGRELESAINPIGDGFFQCVLCGTELCGKSKILRHLVEHAPELRIKPRKKPAPPAQQSFAWPENGAFSSK